MPIYFFRAQHTGFFDEAIDGIELPDDETAFADARAVVCEMAHDSLANSDGARFLVKVHNAFGAVIYVATLDLTAGPPLAA